MMACDVSPVAMFYNKKGIKSRFHLIGHTGGGGGNGAIVFVFVFVFVFVNDYCISYFTL